MKQWYPFVLSLLLVASVSQRSAATHAAALDLTYTCYGNNLYQFVATFYRDCEGIDAPTALTLELNSENCNASNFLTMNLVYSTQGSDTISHLAGLCPELESECSGGPFQGYEQYIYAVTVTLPIECDDWRASTAISARNNAITNLSNPGDQDLYVECHFSNVDLCNTSPQFSIIPLAYSCVDELFIYNHGAYDPDGDSLTYKLVNPLHNAVTPIGYSSITLSPTYPVFTQDGTFGFDSLTGQMSCVPNSQQIVVISVLIYEYRNGVLIGSVQRDLQVVIQPCDNNAPEIPAGITNVIGGFLVDSNTVQVCPGALLEFDLVGVDEDNNDDLSISSNLNIIIPDATYFTVGNNPSTSHFTWQTTEGDTGFYVFTVTIKDDACPIAGQQIYSFSIQVSSPPVDAGPDLYGCENNPVVQLTVDGIAPFLWSNPQFLDSDTLVNPTATLPGAGTYEFIVLADAGGLCEIGDTVQVIIWEEITSSLDAIPDTICSGEPVAIQATASGGDGSYLYSWTSIPPGFTGTGTSINVNPLVTTTYVVTITSGECQHQDSIQILVRPLPSSVISVDTSLCLDEHTQVAAAVNDPDNQYNWTMSSATIHSGEEGGPYDVSWGITGIFLVTLSVSDEFGCSSSSQIPVTVHPFPVAQFTCNIGGCEPLVVQFDNNSTGAVSYNWDFGDGSTGTETDPTHTYNQGVYTVSLTATSAAGCVTTLTLPDLIEVLPVPIACATVAEDITSPIDVSQATFHFENCSQFGVNYLWEFGDGTSSEETNPEHTYTYLDSFYVILTAYNEYCSDTAKIGPIVIDEFIEVYFPSAFSPNSDNANDFFHELSTYGITELYYAVFNRWGELLFETSNLNDQGWDGRFKGKDADVGVYVWWARATFISGKTFDFKGDVTLVR